MKKYGKLGLAIVGFLAFLGIVSVLYGKLTEEYKPQQNLVVEGGSGTQSAEGDEMQGVEDSSGAEGDEMQGAEDSSGANKDSLSNENGADSDSENGTEHASTNTSSEEDAEDVSDAGSTEDQSNLAIDFAMENIAGEEVALFDFLGKPIVLNFWASWCGPCKAEIPDFQEAYEKYEGEIEFLMVNMTDGAQETKESAMKFIEEQGYTLPFYFDTQLQGAYTYGVYSLPTTFFINAEGEMVAYAQGMIDAQTLEQGISMIYEEKSGMQ